MFGWLFKQKEPENYEVLLSNIASDIADRRARLADIRQRQRRAAFWLTVYASATWFAYVGLWYARLLPNVRGGQRGGFDRALKGVPVVLGPLLILFARRIMQAWYTRIGNAEEATLKKLTTKQRETVEDIKKKTNYYSTRNLLERYDEPVPGTPKKLDGTPSAPGAFPGTPQRPGGATQFQTPQRPVQPANGAAANGPPIGRPGAQGPGTMLSPIQQPIGPARRHWYDRLADAVLGEDAEGAATKYALICGRCFAHNGLVKEDAWARTKYTCPQCGFFNEAPGGKRSNNGGITSSASSPATPLSVLADAPGGSAGPVRGIPSSATMPSLRSKAARNSLAAARSPLSASTPVDEEEAEEEEDEVEGDISRMDVDS